MSACCPYSFSYYGGTKLMFHKFCRTKRSSNVSVKDGSHELFEGISSTIVFDLIDLNANM